VTPPSLETLLRGAVDVLPEGRLAEQLAGGRPLRLKLGVDPTSPDIHLGHCVVLTKLRAFQDAGHQVVLIIGDYTARVGDPSGRDSTRPVLTDEQIEANARTYVEQAFKVLDPEQQLVGVRGGLNRLGRHEANARLTARLERGSLRSFDALPTPTGSRLWGGERLRAASTRASESTGSARHQTQS
jgi:tyrosyl-tRNA synthetase